MASEALHPLVRTIHHLLNSHLVSIESPSRKILEITHYAVMLTIELLDFMKHIETKKKKDVEVDVKEAASALEDVLDSHVSDEFVGGDERQPLLFSLDLQGVTQDIAGFLQKLKNIHKVFNPWFREKKKEEEGEEEDRKESDIFALSDGYQITKSMLMSWFATKAASIFLGMKEDYIKELENLLPEDDEDYDYAVLFSPSDISGTKLEYRYSKTKFELTRWWIDKAASFFVTEEECIREIVSPLPQEKEEEEEDYVSSNMVGSADLFCQRRDDLLQYSNIFKVVSFIGMAGIGKTDLVMRIIQDPLFSSKFECRIFARMGPKCELRHMLQAILAQLNPDGDHMLIEDDENIKEYLFNTLLFKKYVIVLDDVWDSSLIHDLFEIIPTTAGSMVLLTTRIDNVAYMASTVFHLHFLNKDESWDLFCEKIFGDKGCPRELEKAGKEIAENCEGLPLLIITVADLLSKAEKTPEYWTKIAADKTNSIFVGAYERILEVLYPSYNYLSQDLQTCFLYMGAFPQNCEVRISKLINLWSAEGFLGDSFSSLHYYVRENYKKLVFDNVVLDPPQRSIMQYNLKACSLHSVFWYLSKRVGWDEKFLHVLNSYTDASKQDIESRRRLAIYKNVILSIKDVGESIASMSAVRSLLCTGPYHQYQVPMCMGLRLLKILDALTIRFYEFPLEVLKLVHLKYLALTCNEIPPSISKLWKLQCLIVHQHLSIRPSVCKLSYVPVEIWYLQELEYLHIMGRNLPDPPPGAVLRNLLILLDVGAGTITKRVVESIPNLEKLRVQIELGPDGVVPLSRRFYDDISRFQVLKSLQCVVANPILVSPSTKVTLVYTRCLRKLTLCGFGYHWKDMNSIAELPNLEELKLQCYAFRGEKWHVLYTEFQKLRYLSIEDTDLVQWTGGYSAFPLLQGLSLKNCYNLQNIPNISSLRDIWLVDCHPSVATCAKKMKLCDAHVDNSYMVR